MLLEHPFNYLIPEKISTQQFIILQWALLTVDHSGMGQIATTSDFLLYLVTITMLIQRYKQTKMTLLKRSEMNWGKERGGRHETEEKVVPTKTDIIAVGEGISLARKSLCSNHSLTSFQSETSVRIFTQFSFFSH